MKKPLRLDSPTARRTLATRDPPYYLNVAKGIAIGFRKGVVQSTWSVRRFNGTKYHRREIGQADDAGFTADGLTVFSWAQVLTIAIGEPARDVAFQTKYSVKQCVEDYFQNRRARSRTSAESLAVDGYKTHAFLEKFGDVQVSELTMSALQRWRDALVASPDDDDDVSDTERRAQQRAAQATANRIWSSVRAALNHAFNSGRVESDLAWRRIKPFRGTDAPRKRFLSVTECNKLLGASPPAFRSLAQAALFTGLRPGELSRLDVDMFEGTRLAVGAGKTDARHVPLTKAGQLFFKKLAKGRAKGDILLPNVEGQRWSRMQWSRAMREAVKEAKLETTAVLYDLRRSYGSLLANAGARDTIIAASLGHVDTRMVRKHYGHLLESTVAAELEAKLPSFSPSRKRATKSAA